MEITIPANTLDQSNPYVFLKEIFTDGNFNTVDVIYPTIAALSVFDPDWIRLLLRKLSEKWSVATQLCHPRYGHLQASHIDILKLLT